MSERAALARKMWRELSDIKSEAIELGRGVDLEAAADRLSAAVEAAGWGPGPEPVTEVEMHGLKQELLEVVERYQWVGARKDHGWHQAGKVLRAVLTSDVLRSRGITVEGEQ